jgi:hypothetical protein
MRTGIVCVTAVAVVALLRSPGQSGGKGPTHESVVKDMLGTVEQIIMVLTNVKDEASAQAARPELKKAGLRMQELRRQAREMKQPTREEKELLEKKYKNQFDEVLKKLRAESLRVKGIPGGPEAVKEIAAVEEKKAPPDEKKKP